MGLHYEGYYIEANNNGSFNIYKMSGSNWTKVNDVKKFDAAKKWIDKQLNPKYVKERDANIKAMREYYQKLEKGRIKSMKMPKQARINKRSKGV